MMPRSTAVGPGRLSILRQKARLRVGQASLSDSESPQTWQENRRFESSSRHLGKLQAKLTNVSLQADCDYNLSLSDVAADDSNLKFGSRGRENPAATMGTGRAGGRPGGSVLERIMRMVVDCRPTKTSPRPELERSLAVLN